MKEYEGKVRMVVKHYPYRYRDHSYRAAQAAEAAGAQGQFWAMHDLMLERKQLDRGTLIGYARELGLDIQRFTRELDGEAHLKTVEKDVQLARSFDIYQTPTYVINGRVLVGHRPIEALRKAVDEALEDSLKEGKPEGNR